MLGQRPPGTARPRRRGRFHDARGRHRIAAGGPARARRHHSCALSTTGEVLCWGSNEYGQLGIGHSAPIVRQPTRVPLPHKATQLVASDFDICALTDDHGISCWGENLRGEAGAPNPAAPRGIRIAWTPYRVELASGARQLSAAFAAACAVRLDGKIVCWGYLTDKLGPALDTATHGEVPEIADKTAVAVGYSHACAIAGRNEPPLLTPAVLDLSRVE